MCSAETYLLCKIISVNKDLHYFAYLIISKTISADMCLAERESILITAESFLYPKIISEYEVFFVCLLFNSVRYLS